MRVGPESTRLFHEKFQLQPTLVRDWRIILNQTPIFFRLILIFDYRSITYVFRMENIKLCRFRIDVLICHCNSYFYRYILS
jgi:hypothetical protein